MTNTTLSTQVAAATLAAAHSLPGTREGWLRLALDVADQASDGKHVVADALIRAAILAAIDAEVAS